MGARRVAKVAGLALVCAGTVSLAALWIGGIYLYWHAHDGNFREATGLGEQDGVPFIAHAECGSPKPIGYVEVREAPRGWDQPSESDPIVFAARARGDARDRVPLTSRVDGYAVRMFKPFRPGARYYVYDLRDASGVNDLASAPDFTTTDLVEGTTVTLDGGEDYEAEGTRASNAQWIAGTAC